ncbi:hypothetical protein [Trueperella sp. LYQ141]
MTKEGGEKMLGEIALLVTAIATVVEATIKVLDYRRNKRDK